ncbi:MAG: threonine--tRNA ligase [Armatimonadetes bacterium]|nr:threonine--tRNA ligase [Armatimonadota bacterium]
MAFTVQAGSLGSRICETPVSYGKILEDIKPEALKETLAVRVDGDILDLSSEADRDAAFEPVTLNQPEGLEILRHSASHLMAAAVQQLFPDAKFAIGPAIEDGFYYDLDLPRTLTPEDLPVIEARMRELAQKALPYEREVIPLDEAIAKAESEGQTYKIEILQTIKAQGRKADQELAGEAEAGSERVSTYRMGSFVDLCRGPHVPDSSHIKIFKLTRIAGAYWRGDERNKMLQRIYGTAFPSEGELKEYLHRLEEAAKRDHRKLGRELGLVSISEEAGAGLVFWHPNGAMVRKIMENFLQEELLKRDYELVSTPHIAKIDLWKTSGHWNFYRENMYSPIRVENEEYMLKPMNCPFHILIYKSQKRSYRDLPIRLAEMGTVYRYERSGVLHGMLRVRGFTQDDAHIFCTPDQLEREITECVDLAFFVLKAFGFADTHVILSTGPDPARTRPEEWQNYAGDPDKWAFAESILRGVLDRKVVPFDVDVGGAAFYGPKIDIKIQDALGREWQGPTIQFDFNLSSRFEVEYVGPDGASHLAYMVHRALLGSFERFMGCLIEHYGGAFPVWLAPVQVKILPITERHVPYANEVAATLRSRGARVKVDARNEKTGYKIREAQNLKIPYMLVVGDREAQGKLVSVRERRAGDLGNMSMDEFLSRITKEIEEKAAL